MKYGHFDIRNREYVIERVDVPVSWTNYLGVEKTCAVVNQTAGGYMFHDRPEYHRVTRFRPNAVPMDRPGHYVYIRDDDTGEYWTVSWQPTGGELKDYRCRHGLSYSVYECVRSGISAGQTLFVPRGEDVELWDVRLRNESGRERNLSVFCYAEFSFHHIQMDNQNFQMSLYASGSSYKDGIIDYNLFYENTHQFMASSFVPEDFDCVRDRFIGAYRTESNPIGVESGELSGSFELGGNHCAALRGRVRLTPGGTERLIFMLGEGGYAEGVRIREKYSRLANVDAAFTDLRGYWEAKLSRLKVNTPSKAMDTMLNIWTLYQSEVNVMFSRFASFIEVGGRTGLGFRDTAQDALAVPHSNPEKCRERIIQLLRGTVSSGYGLHLFQPEWFEPSAPAPFKSPTLVPAPGRDSFVHGIDEACSDDALWLVAAVAGYIKETGDLSFADEIYGYADGGEGTVYEHLRRILDFSRKQVGPHGICLGLRADWNDCLNLGGGESAMVSCLHHWALMEFVALARALCRGEDAKIYEEIAGKVREAINRELWDGRWYLRGITVDGRKIGTHTDAEGSIHLESNVWAVLSGAAPRDRAVLAMDSVDEYLFTRYGLRLNAPSYTKPDDAIGFVTRVYPGVKENGAVFSHPNPWAWAAESVLGRGGRAMKFYDALCPYLQNDIIEVREAEPYSYCQFVMGPDHTAFGRARHPFMTGSAGWSYFSASRYILGVRPDYCGLIIDPCIPPDWKGYRVRRVFRGAVYDIVVSNPGGAEKGVAGITLNGEAISGGIVPSMPAGTVNTVYVTMGDSGRREESEQ